MLVGNTRLVENTREEALKAFLKGSDVRVVIDTAEEHARFLDIRKLLPLDAVYFINVEIKPKDDYEEKVFGTNSENTEKAPLPRNKSSLWRNGNILKRKQSRR